MAVYEYACGKCGKRFAVTMTISERESRRVRCPKCDSLKVVGQVSVFYAQTSKKS